MNLFYTDSLNRNVEYLQLWLFIKNAPNIRVSGVIDLATCRAIQALQAKYGCPKEDGVVDNITWRKILADGLGALMTQNSARATGYFVRTLVQPTPERKQETQEEVYYNI